jgi:hypothetical protein
MGGSSGMKITHYTDGSTGFDVRVTFHLAAVDVVNCLCKEYVHCVNEDEDDFPTLRRTEVLAMLRRQHEDKGAYPALDWLSESYLEDTPEDMATKRRVVSWAVETVRRVLPEVRFPDPAYRGDSN